MSPFQVFIYGWEGGLKILVTGHPWILIFGFKMWTYARRLERRFHVAAGLACKRMVFRHYTQHFSAFSVINFLHIQQFFFFQWLNVICTCSFSQVQPVSKHFERDLDITFYFKIKSVYTNSTYNSSKVIP